MFLGHENGFKNGLVMLTWALSAVATGTGFYLVHQENELSSRDKGYLVAAASLTATALLLLTLIGSDYAIDMINMEKYHLHAMVLAWALLVAAMGIWWWVYNTQIVDRNDQYLLTSAISITVAVAFLTGSVFMERGEQIPILSRVEKSIRKTVKAVTPKRKAVTPKRKSSLKKSSPKRK